MEQPSETPIRDAIELWKENSERLMEDLYFNIISLDEYKEKDKKISEEYQQTILHLTK